jgi:hypothetical protein
MRELFEEYKKLLGWRASIFDKTAGIADDPTGPHLYRNPQSLVTSFDDG